MTSFFERYSKSSIEAIVTIATVAALMAYVAWIQSHWWRTIEDCQFGWLTPLLASYVVYDRWPQIRVAWQQCRNEVAHRFPWAAGTIFTLGAIGLLAGSIQYGTGGPSFKVSLLISLDAGLLILALPILTAPHQLPADQPEIKNRRRFQLIRLLLYPAFVWLLSEPPLSIFESLLSLGVLQPLTKTICTLLTLLGLPVVQSGSIIVLPDGGKVGVEQACSGIRSFAASIYAGCFIGAIFFRRFRWTATLVLASVILAFAINFARVLFLAVWAYFHGAQAITEKLHDLVGYSALAFTVVCLFFLAHALLRMKERQAALSATTR